MPKRVVNAGFIERMLLLRTERLPEGPDRLFELKLRNRSLDAFCSTAGAATMLDGYRALAIKSNGKIQLRSRNDNDFSTR